MSTNNKIITADVSSILDTVILTNSSHPHLAVSVGEAYDSVLAKIAARTPTLAEKQGLDAALSPGPLNPYVTLDEVDADLTGRIAWKTIGLPGSGADFEGSTDAIFTTALASGAAWIHVREGTYTFAATVVVPANLRLTGTGASVTILTGAPATLLRLNQSSQVSYLGAINTGGQAIEVIGDDAEIMNCIVTTSGGPTVAATGVSGLRVWDTVTSGGPIALTVTASAVHGCATNVVAAPGLILQSCDDVSVTGSVLHGQITLTSSGNLRVVANHCPDGITNTTPVGTVMLRANTPATINNEADDFGALLQYLGDPTVTTQQPAYGNNFGGPAGENLTSRAGSLDLLIQWRYEERNFHLVADQEPAFLTWTPVPGGGTLFTSSQLRLLSSHRIGNWTLAQLGSSAALTFAQQTTATTGTSWAGDPTYLGQTFVASSTGQLAQVVLAIANPGALTFGTLVVDLVGTTAGLPSGAALSTSSTVTVVSIGAATTFCTFTFSNPPLVGSTTYALVLRSISGTLAGNLSVMGVQPSGYGSGTQVTSSNLGASWMSVAIRDLYFVVTGQVRTTLAIQDGYALYYVLDRNLGNTDLPLTYGIAPLGSLPNTSQNRQVWVLAFSRASTLWWRGGGGTRMPASGPGDYFVDGSSLSLLRYIGATDYNQSQPVYSSNFAGLQGENLVTRLNHHDVLIRRLFEYSNLGVSIQDAGYIGCDTAVGVSTLTLTSTLYFSLPHVAGRLTLAAQSWVLADQQMVYCTWNQAALAGTDLPVMSTTVAAIGTLPLPDNYPGDGSGALKWFVLARRLGGSIFLWDGTEVPTTGGRWPVPVGRQVVRTTAATILADNFQWDGTNFRWEGAAVATATGTALSYNGLANQTVASPGLTDLTDGTGLLVTHTWNPVTPGNCTVAKVTLPLVNVIKQNQFLWVQNRSGVIVLND